MKRLDEEHVLDGGRVYRLVPVERGLRSCPECGEEFLQRRKDQRYCRAAHKHRAAVRAYRQRQKES